MFPNIRIDQLALNQERNPRILPTDSLVVARPYNLGIQSALYRLHKLF